MEFITSIVVQVFEYENYEQIMTGDAAILHTWSREYFFHSKEFRDIYK